MSDFERFTEAQPGRPPPHAGQIWGPGADLVEPAPHERSITAAYVKIAATGEMLMPKFVEVVPWVASNKDALLALAAFLAPVTSIIVGLVSYRAVVTGPKVQLRIAQRTEQTD